MADASLPLQQGLEATVDRLKINSIAPCIADVLQSIKREARQLQIEHPGLLEQVCLLESLLLSDRRPDAELVGAGEHLPSAAVLRSTCTSTGPTSKRESLETVSPTSELAISARASRASVTTSDDVPVVALFEIDEDLLLPPPPPPPIAPRRALVRGGVPGLLFARLATDESGFDSDARLSPGVGEATENTVVAGTCVAPLSLDSASVLSSNSMATDVLLSSPTILRRSVSEPAILAPLSSAFSARPPACVVPVSPSATQPHHGGAANVTSSNAQVESVMDIAFLHDGALGFTVAGGVDSPLKPSDPKAYVTAVLRDGAADRDGRLQVGDALLQVDGESVSENCSQSAVVQLLKSKGTWVTLRVLRQSCFLQRQVHVIDLPPSPTDTLQFFVSPDGTDGPDDPVASTNGNMCVLCASPSAVDSTGAQWTVPCDETAPLLRVVALTGSGWTARDNRLCVGDYLLMVNATPLTSGPFALAMVNLKTAATGLTGMKLIVERFVASQLPETLFDLTIFPSAVLVEPTTDLSQAVQRRFGLTIVGGTDQRVDGVDPSIYIANVEPGSAAEQTHHLRFGDRVVEVAGQPLHRSTHAAALRAFIPRRLSSFSPQLSASPFSSGSLGLGPDAAASGVRVRVARLAGVDPSRELVWHVAVVRPGPGHMLGFTVAGGTDDRLSLQDGSVYITSIAGGGALAKADPCAQVGDRILVANGQSLCNVRHSTAATILRSNPAGANLTLTRWVGATRVTAASTEQSPGDAVARLTLHQISTNLRSAAPAAADSWNVPGSAPESDDHVGSMQHESTANFNNINTQC